MWIRKKLSRGEAQGGCQGRCQPTDWPVGTCKAAQEGLPENHMGEGGQRPHKVQTEALIIGMNCLHLHPLTGKPGNIQDTRTSSLILTRKMRYHSHSTIRKLKPHELLKSCDARQNAAVIH